MEGSLNVWMQLLGFEKNDPDRGVARFLQRTGFVPQNVCALLFHADFVHLHSGMEKEYPLLKANCAYRGIAQNKERKRQDWTNYDLRALIGEWKKRGVGFYLGLMGSYLKDRFHREWLSEHPELRCSKIDRPGGLACLKRFRDGRYYEDFFIEKLTQVLLDYDCEGVHLSDEFCPMCPIFRGDWSWDMTEQFGMHTGLSLPKELTDTRGDDDFSACQRRQEYVWKNLRKEWIAFYQWRWQRFFEKLCSAVHKIGKKVWILGMYCTDPFESRYVYGFDCKQAMEAGVDCITANILPSSVSFEKPEFPYYFHKMHMDLPLLRAQLGEDGGILAMVGVQDASEEWSMLEHQPMKLERDILTVSSWVNFSKGRYARCSKGLFFCLGDGIDVEGWRFLKKRSEAAMEGEVEKSYSPLLLWSDAAHEAMLEEYVACRRPSVHKQAFEVAAKGTPLGGVVRSEESKAFDGVLFVPNFDLLSPWEQEALKERSSPWLGTCRGEASLGDAGISPSFYRADPLGDPALALFAVGWEPKEGERESLDRLLQEADPTPSRRNEAEAKIHPLLDQLPFGKLSQGFVKACAFVLARMRESLFPLSCNYPMLAFAMKGGKDRLYLLNPCDNGYCTAVVTAPSDMKSAEIQSTYPVLPPRFLAEGESGVYYDFDKEPSTRKRFEVKLAPDGVTVVDVIW